MTKSYRNYIRYSPKTNQTLLIKSNLVKEEVDLFISTQNMFIPNISKINLQLTMPLAKAHGLVCCC